MGIVYKAHDTVIGRDVALKTVTDLEGAVALEQFYKEWHVLASLQHPNIVEIYDIGEIEEHEVLKPFFVMPLLTGATLGQQTNIAEGQRGVERFAGIMAQICRALSAIHEHGLIHRDIKPRNVFVTRSDTVKLIDFGVAHIVGCKSSTGIKGTASYMAPEQIQGRQCTPQTDIFSLGILCYEMLAGTQPFHGERTQDIWNAILYGTPRPLDVVNPGIGRELAVVIHKALAKEPEHRFQSTQDFATAFQRAFQGECVTFVDNSHFQSRIHRAVRAFELGDLELAVHIVRDLESLGHVDPTLTWLREKVDGARRVAEVADFLARARRAVAGEEWMLALRNVESALEVDPANDVAAQLEQQVQAHVPDRSSGAALPVQNHSVYSGGLMQHSEEVLDSPAAYSASSLPCSLSLKDQSEAIIESSNHSGSVLPFASGLKGCFRCMIGSTASALRAGLGSSVSAINRFQRCPEYQFIRLVAAVTIVCGLLIGSAAVSSANRRAIYLRRSAERTSHKQSAISPSPIAPVEENSPGSLAIDVRVASDLRDSSARFDDQPWAPLDSAGDIGVHLTFGNHEIVIRNRDREVSVHFTASGTGVSGLRVSTSNAMVTAIAASGVGNSVMVNSSVALESPKIDAQTLPSSHHGEFSATVRELD
jgi:hypothetical protein